MRASSSSAAVPGQLGAAGAPARVARGDHDDPPVRQARAARRRRSPGRRRPTRVVRPRDLERGPARAALRSAERLRDAVGQPRVAVGAGLAVGERARELVERVALRPRGVAERDAESNASAAQPRRRRGGPVRERERRDEHGDQRGQEGGPVDPYVEHRIYGTWRFPRLSSRFRGSWPTEHRASCSSTTSSRSRRCCRSRCSGTATTSCRPPTAARRSPASPSRPSTSSCST